MRRSMLRRWHVRTGLVALLVTVAAVFAATANAGRTTVLAGAPYSPACGVGTSFFDSLAARTSGARGEGREPSLNQVLEEVPAGQAPSTANFHATIPVYIHVIRTGSAVEQGNVPNAWIHNQIDVLNRKVLAGDHELHLTSLEQALLYLLAANAGSVLTREQILDALWGTDFVIESNVVDRHVRALRAKLQNDWHKPRYIETVPGTGYRFVPGTATKANGPV